MSRPTTVSDSLSLGSAASTPPLPPLLLQSLSSLCPSLAFPPLPFLPFPSLGPAQAVNIVDGGAVLARSCPREAALPVRVSEAPEGPRLRLRLRLTPRRPPRAGRLPLSLALGDNDAPFSLAACRAARRAAFFANAARFRAAASSSAAPELIEGSY